MVPWLWKKWYIFQSMWNLGTYTSWFCLNSVEMNIHLGLTKSTGICTKISHTLVCTTFPKVSGRKQFFYLHIILEYVATEGFSLQLRNSRVFIWAQFEIQRFLATNNGFEHILLLICQSPKIELFQTILKSCQTFNDLKQL